MNLRRLLQSAVVLPADPGDVPHAMGAGSVIGLLDPPQERVSMFPGDTYVAYNHGGIEKVGWLSSNRSLGHPTISRKIHSTAVEGELLPHDVIRESIFKFRQQVRKDIRERPKLVPLLWAAMVGPMRLAELRAVVREFGGRVSKQDDASEQIVRAMRIILNRKELTMQDVEEAREKTSKKSKKERLAAKAAKKARIAAKKAKQEGVAKDAADTPIPSKKDKKVTAEAKAKTSAKKKVADKEVNRAVVKHSDNGTGGDDKRSRVFLKRYMKGESPSVMAKEKGRDWHVNKVRRMMVRAAGGLPAFKKLMKKRRASLKGE